MMLLWKALFIGKSMNPLGWVQSTQEIINKQKFNQAFIMIHKEKTRWCESEGIGIEYVHCYVF
jgi:hypothetical protein